MVGIWMAVWFLIKIGSISQNPIFMLIFYLSFLEFPWHSYISPPTAKFIKVLKSAGGDCRNRIGLCYILITSVAGYLNVVAGF
jgi:hypothetical protein